MTNQPCRGQVTANRPRTCAPAFSRVIEKARGSKAVATCRCRANGTRADNLVHRDSPCTSILPGLHWRRMRKPSSRALHAKAVALRQRRDISVTNFACGQNWPGNGMIATALPKAQRQRRRNERRHREGAMSYARQANAPGEEWVRSESCASASCGGRLDAPRSRLRRLPRRCGAAARYRHPDLDRSPAEELRSTCATTRGSAGPSGDGRRAARRATTARMGIFDVDLVEGLQGIKPLRPRRQSTDIRIDWAGLDRAAHRCASRAGIQGIAKPAMLARSFATSSATASAP